MLNKIFAAILLLGILGPVWADNIQVKPNHPESYVVKKGDTLWDISGRFLEQPWRWPEIWKVNPQIKNPNLIYPGDVVKLTYVGGKPELTVSRGGAAGAQGSRVVKLEPKVESTPNKQAIPSIPIEAIHQFLTRPKVVSATEMNDWPYVVSSYNEHLVAGPGNTIYVRGMSGNPTGQHYAIYRKGPALHEGGKPDGKLLGYEAIYVGNAVFKRGGDPATAVITKAQREVLVGDRLVEEKDQALAAGDFTPSPPASPVKGSIISVLNGMSEIGQYNVVVLDVGTDEGLKVGNVLGVYQRGAVVKDQVAANNPSHGAFLQWLGTGKPKEENVRLPSTHAAVVMVIRTFQKVSYALVMQATSPLHIRDTVRSM